MLEVGGALPLYLPLAVWMEKLIFDYQYRMLSTKISGVHNYKHYWLYFLVKMCTFFVAVPTVTWDTYKCFMLLSDLFVND
jgi:hypothetical protein